MKRSHSSAIRSQEPVFLDPAYPTYRGYVPPPIHRRTTGGEQQQREEGDDHDNAHGRSKPSVTELDRVDAQLITPQHFFETYVYPRKPCVLFNLTSGVVPPAGEDEENGDTRPTTTSAASAALKTLDPTELMRALGACLKDQTFQLEVRQSSHEAFGQNRTVGRQVEMTFGEFLESIPNSQKSLYYLSTQQQKPKHGGNALGDAYDPTCSRLVDALETLTMHPDIGQALDRLRQLSGHLVLDSKHGWLGFASMTTTATGRSVPNDDGTATSPTPMSCSGLHHDFHDNFNVQIVGTKVWTLYPPIDYPHIPLYGTVHGLHGVNGLLCYRDNVTRADGVPLAMLLLEDDEDDDDDGVESSEDENGESMAFGFAGGEESGSDEGEDEESRNGGEGDDDLGNEPPNKADFVRDGLDLLQPCRNDDNHGTDEGRASKDAQGAPSRRNEAERRPNSFSPVDMTLSAEERARRHPDFCPRHEVTVHVRAGEALYLPASWFHSVASLADASVAESTPEKDSNAASALSYPPYHLAVNYWYHPPDHDSYLQPYRNDYWAKHATNAEQVVKSEPPWTGK